MTIQDPISDMFTRMRNSSLVNKPSVDVPASKFKRAILDLLLENGFINSHATYDINGIPYIKIDLKYFTSRTGAVKSVIQSIKKVSKPSLRVYKGSSELPKVRGGSGLAIISTSEGLMSAANASQKHLGGEIIAEVY